MQMPPFCKPQYQYSNMNVRQITVDGAVSWTETKDHSKVPPYSFDKPFHRPIQHDHFSSGRLQKPGYRDGYAWVTSTDNTLKRSAEEERYAGRILPLKELKLNLLCEVGVHEAARRLVFAPIVHHRT